MPPPPAFFDEGHWDEGFFDEQPQNPNATHTMTNDNRISIAIAPADKTAFLAKVAELRTLALTFAVAMTAEDRKKIPTIGTKREAMVATFDTQMELRDDLVPSFLVAAEKAKDSTAWVDINDLLAPLDEVKELLGDTKHLVGADLLTAYRAFYAAVQQAAEHGVAGADTCLNALKPFFPRGGSGGATPPPGGTP